MQLPEFLHLDADGEIRLKGHRIRLIDVAARYEEGHAPETIVLDHYPTLGLSLVHKTIGFYLDHQAEVQELLRQMAESMERLAAEPRRPTPSLNELRRRMQAVQRAEAS